MVHTPVRASLANSEGDRVSRKARGLVALDMDTLRLGEDFLHVVFHGAGADEQSRADVGVGVPVAGQLLSVSRVTTTEGFSVAVGEDVGGGAELGRWSRQGEDGWLGSA